MFIFFKQLTQGFRFFVGGTVVGWGEQGGSRILIGTQLIPIMAIY